MMTLYSKTTEVEKAQQMDQHQARVAQQSVIADDVRTREVKQAQVQKSEQQAQASGIRENPHRKKGKKLPNQEGETEIEQGENEEQSGEGAQARTGPMTGNIDIRI